VTGEQPVALGFDIGGTNIRALPVNQDGPCGDWLHERRPEDPDALIDTVAYIVAEAATSYEVSAVGIGCAGIVDRAGMVHTSPNIPTLRKFPLRERLLGRIDVPVTVDNDGTTGAYAEWVSGGRATDNLAFVALGTGIGGGFVLNGDVYRGGSGFAGEIGHITVLKDGIPCVCGRRGCWERYASGSALGHQAQWAAVAGRAPTVLAAAGGVIEDIHGEHVADLVGEGNPEALELLGEFASWVALGIDCLIQVLDPGVFVIGGGVSEIGDPLIDAINTAYANEAVDTAARGLPEIRRSVFGGRAGAIGAGLLALAELDNPTPRRQ
jgi:glucokinase